DPDPMKMKENPTVRAIALVLACATSSLVACGTNPPRGTAVNTYAGDLSGHREQFVGDRDLAAKFVLLNIRTEPSDGSKPRRVQFDLKNTTGGALAVEWALDWKDASGFRIDTNPHWQPVMVAGQNSHSIQASAPPPAATSFQLQLRKPT